MDLLICFFVALFGLLDAAPTIYPEPCTFAEVPKWSSWDLFNPFNEVDGSETETYKIARCINGLSIQKLPRDIEVLYISGNEFSQSRTALFDILKTLPSLVAVAIDLCDLTQQTTSRLFRKNPQLQYVSIAQCHTDQFSFPNGDLLKANSKLKVLTLASSGITDIPTGLTASNFDLESVDYSQNELESIEEGIFQRNVKLQEISLHGNLLTSLPENAFSGLLLLEELDLSGNEIEFLPENLLFDNKALTRFDFTGNSIASLPPNLFKFNPKLQRLYFSNNRISYIPRGVFRHQPELFVVYFDNNAIITRGLPSDLFEYNNRVFFVDFSGNAGLLAELAITHHGITDQAKILIAAYGYTEESEFWN